MNDIEAAAARPAEGVNLTPLAIWAVAVYVCTQVISNVASLKIGLVGGYAVDMGTFLYPVAFTLRDVAHKLIGRRNARSMIYAAGAINLGMAAYFEWVARVPGDPSWGLAAEFAAILSPVWRLVAASILAQVVSEIMDTEIYHWFVTRITRRFHWLRVVVSNTVSVPVDNVIFAVGAFGFALPWETVWQIFVFNLAVKYLVTLGSVPLIYLVSPRREASHLA